MRKINSAVAAVMSQNWYKVLDMDMRSMHGGTHTWELGKWYELPVPPVACSHGFHLTRVIPDWIAGLPARVFKVQIDWKAGYDASQMFEHGSSKISVRRCRLITELTDDELALKGVMMGAVKSDQRRIVNGDNVRIYGEAYGETASEYQILRAYGESRVYADLGSTIAYDTVQVDAAHQSYVRACGSGRVEAYGNSIVKVSGDSEVFARSSATVIIDSYEAKVFLEEDAKAVVRSGPGSVRLIGKKHSDPANAIIGGENGRDKWKVVKRNGQLQFVPR